MNQEIQNYKPETFRRDIANKVISFVDQGVDPTLALHISYYADTRNSRRTAEAVSIEPVEPEPDQTKAYKVASGRIKEIPANVSKLKSREFITSFASWAIGRQLPLRHQLAAARHQKLRAAVMESLAAPITEAEVARTSEESLELFEPASPEHR